MKCFYDFHVHTGLSPCAEDEMSPWNVVNMAIIKGLNAIAVTDHNSIGNVKPFLEAGKAAGLLVIPGMELQTREEVHLLCLFLSLEDAQVFEDRIDPLRLRIANKPERFGHQYLYNTEDEVVGEYPWSLLTSIDISLDEAVRLVRRRGGVALPCHLDRKANSLLYTLGFLPSEPVFPWVEISRMCKEMPKGLSKDLKILYNSDAHVLADIAEAEHSLEVDELTISGIFNVLGGLEV